VKRSVGQPPKHRKGLTVYIKPEICDRLGLPIEATPKEAIAVIERLILAFQISREDQNDSK
jgi:NAD-dependent dihydropyrimidine dehydrogenase PreA subunit